MKWVEGMVLYPFVLFKNEKGKVPKHIFKHEMQHIYQIQREGLLTFYLLYLYYFFKYGYINNPYEVEARSKEWNALTAEEYDLMMRD